MGILSFPFRLDPTGRASTIPEGGDAEVDEAIAVLVLTAVGERPMVPQFGIPDPAFHGIDVSDVQVGLDQYGPSNVQITAVNVRPRTESRSDAEIRWTRTGQSTGKDGLV